MNILVYSHVATWEQHHAESIEIANKCLDQGHNVFYLSCDSSLKNCPANYFKNRNYCKECLLQTEYTNKKILSKKIHKIYLKTEKKKINIKINSIDDLYNYKFDGVNLGLPVLSTMITDQYRDCFLDIKKIKNQAIDFLQSTIGLYLTSKKIITNYSIDQVYVWNGRRMSDAPIVLAAKKLKKKYFTFMSGGKIGNFLSQSSATVHDLEYNKRLIKKFYDKYKKKKEFIVDAEKFYSFMRYGTLDKKEKIYAYGYIPFNKYFLEKNVFDSSNKKKKLAIFTSSLWEYISLGDDFFKKNGKKINHYKILSQILSNKLITKNYEICVRWHPFLREVGENEKKIIDKIILTYNNVSHIKPSDNINSYALLESSDIVLTFGSTIGVEACYYGKPSILMGRSYYEDTGAVYKPKNFHSLLTLLMKKNIKIKDYEHAYKYGFFDRNRGLEKFRYVKSDAKLRWYYKCYRIRKMNIKKLIIENLNFLLEMLRLKFFLKKIKHKILLLLNIKKDYFQIYN